MSKQHSLLILNEIDKELGKTVSPRNFVSPQPNDKENDLKKYSVHSPTYTKSPAYSKANKTVAIPTQPYLDKQENTLSLTISPQLRYSEKPDDTNNDALYNKITSRIKKMMEEVDGKCNEINNKISALINSSP